MSLSIHTSFASLLTQTSLSKTNRTLSVNQQRLGSGFRINSAADDAAGLQIASRLSTQSRGMGIAMRNVTDATALLATGEGAFNEMTAILDRMKELSTQSATDNNSPASRTAMQSEFDNLGKELANVMTNTANNGEQLFGLDGGTGKFGLGPVIFQIGATSAEVLSFDVSAATKALATAIEGVTAAYKTPATPGVEINTQATANATIDKIAAVLDSIGAVRGEFGSNINRLNHTNNNLANMKDNTDIAHGNIMDADFALESSLQSKNTMLLQSGISMLKQTSQMPQLIMSLLS